MTTSEILLKSKIIKDIKNIVYEQINCRKILGYNYDDIFNKIVFKLKEYESDGKIAGSYLDRGNVQLIIYFKTGTTFNIDCSVSVLNM